VQRTLRDVASASLVSLTARPLGNPFFGKGYNSFMAVVVSLRDFADEMQTLSDEKEIAYDS